MKNLLKTVLGLSILAGSASYAQSNLNNIEQNFYPKSFEERGHFKTTNKTDLLKNSIPSKVLASFYPEKENDSPKYNLNSSVEEFPKNAINLARPSLSTSFIKEVYPDTES